jgi:ubiquinone/menaquinone biosynthesis C-methylase UbiE
MTKNIWENAYNKFGEDLPWCVEVASWFKTVIKSKWIKPCKTLDMGCGVGNYASYLASQGFGVTAIDISKKAISVAREKHQDKNLKFKVHDIFKLKDLKQKFDFIYEVSILHNIPPEKREKYIKGIHAALKENGKLMVCSFSKDDLIFGGKEKLYIPDIDNTMYALSEKQIRDMFSDYFEIDKLKKVYFGKRNKRKRERFLCLMTKKGS